MKLKLINHLNRSAMTCAEANKIDLVEYLFSLGNTPTKIRGNDYWYLSPFRDEKEASFKINKLKNAWYDHGAGKGGDVVDFITSYFSCDVSTALQKLSSFNHIPQKQIISAEMPGTIIFPEVSQPELFNEQATSNQQIKQGSHTGIQHEERPPFHLHKNSLINHRNAAETAIEIIAARKPITDLMFCRYLKERRIDKNIADSYRYEVTFKFSNKDTKHTAIGFKNNAGGYELRNSFFKLSSSPKYVTYINNNEETLDTKTNILKDDFNTSIQLKNEDKNDTKNLLNQPSIVSQNEVSKSSLKNDFKDKLQAENQSTKQAKSIVVFEGFFDFLTHQTIYQNQIPSLTDFLVLNSLSFFEKSLLLMEKHEHIHLFLDHDEAGKKCLEIASRRSLNYKDESSLLQKKQSLKVSNKNRLLQSWFVSQLCFGNPKTLVFSCRLSRHSKK